MIPLEILVADQLRLLPRLEVQFFHHEGRGAVRVAMGGESLFDSGRRKRRMMTTNGGRGRECALHHMSVGLLVPLSLYRERAISCCEDRTQRDLSRRGTTGRQETRNNDDDDHRYQTHGRHVVEGIVDVENDGRDLGRYSIDVYFDDAINVVFGCYRHDVDGAGPTATTVAVAAPREDSR